MSHKINIVLTLIIFVLIGYIIYDKYYSNNIVTNDISETIIDNRRNGNSDVKYYNYSRDIKSIDEENSDRVYKSVYLFDDNTYYYGYSDYKDECNNWSKGEYELDGNIITLNEKMYGGCNTCYYTDNLKTFSFRIINDSLVSESNELLALSKADILPIIDVEKLDGVKHCSN